MHFLSRPSQVSKIGMDNHWVGVQKRYVGNFDFLSFCQVIGVQSPILAIFHDFG